MLFMFALQKSRFVAFKKCLVLIFFSFIQNLFFFYEFQEELTFLILFYLFSINYSKSILENVMKTNLKIDYLKTQIHSAV